MLTMRSACELENYIIAVERIKEYAEHATEVSKYMYTPSTSLKTYLSISIPILRIIFFSLVPMKSR